MIAEELDKPMVFGFIDSMYDDLQVSAYRTHLTSFPVVLGFEVSRRSVINDRACSAKPFSGIKWENQACCFSSASRSRYLICSIAVRH